MNTDKIEVVEVSKPKLTGANIARTGGLMFGLIVTIIGILMCISLILLIPGLFAVLVGIVVMALNLPKTTVACPACDYENKIAHPNVSVACERCKTNIPVKWAE